MDLQAIISRLCAVAPSLGERLDTQAYRVNIEEDNISVRRLVDDLFEQLIDILTNEYGIEFIQLEELMGSVYHQEQLLRLAELIMPGPLSTLMTQDSTFRRFVQDAVRDTLSDEPTVLQLVTYAAQSNMLRAQYQDTFDVLVDRVSSSGVFDAYLDHMCNTIEDITTFSDSDVEATIPYVNHVRALKRRIQTAMYSLSSHLPSQQPYLDSTGLLDLAKLGVYMTSPANINALAWAFMRSQDEEISTLDRELIEKYTVQLHVAQPFFVEHYLAKGEITLNGFLYVLCYLAAMHQTKDSFGAAVKQVLDLLTERNVQFADKSLPVMRRAAEVLSEVIPL